MKKETVAFSALHLLMTLAIPVLLFLLVGCLEKPEAKMVDLGPESAPDDVEFELSKATSGKGPSSMKLGPVDANGEYKNGERVDYEVNIRIENEDIIKISDITQQLVSIMDDVNDAPDLRRYAIHDRTTTYDAGTPDTVEKEFYIDVKKSDDLAAQAFNSPVSFLRLNSVVAMNSDPIRQTYHNLFVEKILVPAPDRVAQEPNCLGLENCQLKATHITFTRADWYSDASREITHFNFTFSTDAPYLGVALNGCLNFLYKANGREYLVTQCQVLRDFRFGED